MKKNINFYQIDKIIQKIQDEGTHYICSADWKEVTNNFDEEIIEGLILNIDIYYLKELNDALLRAWINNKPSFGHDADFLECLRYNIKERLDYIGYCIVRENSLYNEFVLPKCRPLSKFKE